MIRSTPATERSTSTLHSSIGLPPSATSALGRSDPRRSPRPAATINATATCFAVLAYSAATVTFRVLLRFPL